MDGEQLVSLENGIMIACSLIPLTVGWALYPNSFKTKFLQRLNYGIIAGSLVLVVFLKIVYIYIN